MNRQDMITMTHAAAAVSLVPAMPLSAVDAAFPYEENSARPIGPSHLATDAYLFTDNHPGNTPRFG